MILKNTKNTRS